jgi:hypothetical protein
MLKFLFFNTFCILDMSSKSKHAFYQPDSYESAQDYQLPKLPISGSNLGYELKALPSLFLIFLGLNHQIKSFTTLQKSNIDLFDCVWQPFLSGPSFVPPYHLETTTRTFSASTMERRCARRAPAWLSPSSLQSHAKAPETESLRKRLLTPLRKR